MYLNLTQEVLYDAEIVGIFDLDTATVAHKTRSFLNRAEKEKKAVTLSFDLPRSFIVAQGEAETDHRVYISQLSSLTLVKRSESGGEF